MMQGLRELFASQSEKGRFWLAVAILAALLVVYRRHIERRGTWWLLKVVLAASRSVLVPGLCGRMVTYARPAGLARTIASEIDIFACGPTSWGRTPPVTLGLYWNGGIQWHQRG